MGDTLQMPPTKCLFKMELVLAVSVSHVSVFSICEMAKDKENIYGCKNNTITASRCAQVVGALTTFRMLLDL